MQADFSTFLLRRSEGPRNDLVRLNGARLVTASEIADGQRLDESLMKSLTGGDVIAARQLYHEAIEFHLQAKFLLAANHKPIVRGRDHAIWRRFRLLPFTVTIPEEERDPQLAERLREELPGILAWAVDGCLAWQQGSLQAPAEVLAATEDYRAEMDVLGAFIADRCVVANGVSVQATPLYAAYRAWATQGHEELLSSTRFGREMATRFPKEKDSRGRIVYLGLMVDSERSEGLGGLESVSANSPREEVTGESYGNAPSTLHNPPNAARGAGITPISAIGQRAFEPGDAWEGDDTLGRGAA
jgi:putative DNA primase/helicase